MSFRLFVDEKAVNSTEVGLNFSYPSSVDMNARRSTLETICLQCGDRGFTNAFVYCIKCLQFAVHRYCLDVMPNTVDGFARWVCDDCDVEVQNQPVEAFECHMDGNFGGEHNSDFEDDNVQKVKQESNIDQAPNWKRYETQGMQPRINLYYKYKVLQTIRMTLLKIGEQPLLDRFEDECFGHLLRWRNNKTCAKALHELMSREIELDGASSDEVWFCVGGRNIRFSPIDYALVTGLRFGSSDFDPSDGQHDPSSSQVYRRFCIGQPITLKDLLDRFTRQLGDELNHDDYLKVANVLALYFFGLGYSDPRRVDPWVWVLVDDLERWNRFPWGAYTYGALMHFMTLVPKTRHAVRDRYHFYGPVWALQIWAFEMMPELGLTCAELVESEARPRCLRWFFATPKVKDFLQFFNQLQPEGLQFLEGEQESSYWMSVQTTHPFGVRYIIPRNPITEGQGAHPSLRRAATVARQTIERNLPCRSAASASTRQTRRMRSKRTQPAPDQLEDDPDTDYSVHNTRVSRSLSICPRNKRKRIREPRSSSSSGGDRGRQYQDLRADRNFIEVVSDRVVEKIKILNREMKREIIDEMKQWFQSIGGSQRSLSRHTPSP